MDRETAKQTAEDFVNSQYENPGDNLVVIDSETIEKPYGWVFFYCSRLFLQTGDSRYELGGNAPIVVLRADGSLRSLPTAYSTERGLEILEAQLKI